MYTILKKKDGYFRWIAIYRNDDYMQIVAVYRDIADKDIMNDYKIVKTENNETILED